MQELNITIAMFQKMRYNNLQAANPMHPDTVTSGCDRGGSTTF